MKIVAFAGLARAGKTSAANVFTDLMHLKGQRVVKASFAGPIRDGLEQFGITKAEHGGLYRELAQTVGARCREESDDWWVSVTARKAEEAAAYADYFVIDDVRYPNEVQYLKDIGAHLVYVDGHKRLGSALDNPMYLHDSELMARTFTRLLMEGHSSPLLDKFDTILDSNGPYVDHMANVSQWVSDVF